MSNKTVAAWAAIAGVLSGFGMFVVLVGVNVDSPILAILGGFVLFLGGAVLSMVLDLIPREKEQL